MLRIILSGACGRMGHQVADKAEEFDIRIVCGVDVRDDGTRPFPVYPQIAMAEEEADVIVDFSRPEGLKAILAYALQKKLPVLLAATGYNEQDVKIIEEAAKEIPVFRSANLSLGVYVLSELSQRAAGLLADFDVEIVEKHHNQKIDAPSGTALMLLDAVKTPETQPVFGRHTRTEKRQKNEIGVHAIRGGTLAGEHEVGFYGPGESLLITHTAQDRSIFASGALKAARFIAGQKPGTYDMKDLARSLLEK